MTLGPREERTLLSVGGSGLDDYQDWTLGALGAFSMGRKHIGVQVPHPHPHPHPGLSSPLLHWGESVGLRVMQWILSWAPQIRPLDPVSVLGGVPGERGISRKLPGSAMALLTPISSRLCMYLGGTSWGGGTQ